MKGFALSFLVLWAAPAFCEGPVFQHKEPVMQQEFENVYKDIRHAAVNLSSTTLPAGSTNYIRNTDTLQSGATFFVNKGTINGPFAVTGTFSVPTTGEVTQPLQPSFAAFLGATSANLTGDGTAATVIFDSEQYDQGADFNPVTGIFTAPVTGKYLLSAGITLLQISSGTHTDILGRVVTSNLSYYNVQSITSGVSSTFFITITVVADMDANDTASFVVEVDGASKVVDVQGSGSQARSYFSGSLIN